MHANGRNRLEKIAKTRRQELDDIKRLILKPRPCHIYGVRGIGKRTLVQCLAFELTPEWRFVRVQVDVRRVFEWNGGSGEWSQVESKESSDLSDALKSLTLDSEATLTKKVVFVLEDCDVERGDSEFLNKEAINRLLSLMASPEFRLILVTEANVYGEIGPSTGRNQHYRGILGRDYWAPKYSLGLLKEKSLMNAAVDICFEENDFPSQTPQRKCEYRSIVADVAGPHPGQISSVVGTLSLRLAEFESYSCDDVKAKLLEDQELRRYFKDELWKRIQKEANVEIIVKGIAQVNRDKSAGPRLTNSEMKESLLALEVPLTSEEVNRGIEWIVNGKSSFGQLVLPWDKTRLYSEAFAKFIEEQLPKAPEAYSAFWQVVENPDTTLWTIVLSSILSLLALVWMSAANRQGWWLFAAAVLSPLILLSVLGALKLRARSELRRRSDSK